MNSPQYEYLRGSFLTTCTIKRFTDSAKPNSLGEPTKTISTIATGVICDIQHPVPIPFFVGFAGIISHDPPGEYQLKVPQIFFNSVPKTSGGTAVTIQVGDIIISNSLQYELLELYDWETHFVGSLRKITI